MFELMRDMEKLTGRQCRAARALAGWHQKELASRANVFLRTLVDFENEKRDAALDTRRKIAVALDAAGVSLLEGEGVAVKRAA